MQFIDWNENRLEDLVKLWNRELGATFPMRQKLFKQNSFEDKNVCYEGSKIVINDDDYVIGFVVAKYFQELDLVHMHGKTGWIQVLLVDQRYRNQGIGKRLLQHVENIFIERELDQILLGRDPYHYFPGIPTGDDDTINWFTAHGYEKQVTEFDFYRHFHKDEPIVQPEFSDVTFELLQYEDRENFIQFLNRCFPGRWEYEAIKYFELGGRGREFVVLKKRGHIVGFCRVNDAESILIAQNVYWAPLFDVQLGGVGPLGIDDQERGNGYGLAIVEAGIAELRNRGIQDIVIDWTTLIEFYQKLGFAVWKSYESLTKKI